MRLAAEHGYPVPQVFDVDGADMLLGRLDGVDMLTDIGRRPWRAREHARVLGDLHLRLRSLGVSGAALPGREPGASLVHGDLHPGNVVLTSDGPVVIDWEGASMGPPDTDAAVAWLLMWAARPDDVPAAVRPFVAGITAVMRRDFLRITGRPAPETIDRVCRARLDDRNTRPGERARIRAFRERHAAGGSSPGSP